MDREQNCNPTAMPRSPLEIDLDNLLSPTEGDAPMIHIRSFLGIKPSRSPSKFSGWLLCSHSGESAL